MYIGDDVTDEDAFAIMGGLGGVGIIVSETARETSARYGLRIPSIQRSGSLSRMCGARSRHHTLCEV